MPKFTVFVDGRCTRELSVTTDTWQRAKELAEDSNLVQEGESVYMEDITTYNEQVMTVATVAGAKATFFYDRNDDDG